MSFLRGIGGPELLLILVVAMLLFGAKRLPEMGRSLGRSMKEFKAGVKGLADDDDEDRPAVTAAREEPSDMSSPRDSRKLRSSLTDE